MIVSPKFIFSQAPLFVQNKFSCKLTFFIDKPLNICCTFHLLQLFTSSVAFFSLEMIYFGITFCKIKNRGL